MKAVILAGGLGTRIAEETIVRPKPMIEIGGRPLLWHIMKIYARHGITDFIICCGYKGYMIKEYFSNYCLHMSDVTVDLRRGGGRQVHEQHAEPWRVTLVDTGECTMTGGRLRRIRSYLEDGEPFCFTYGDGVADVNISAEIAFHRSHGKLATVCAVRPAGRYGVLECDGTLVRGFHEKAEGERSLINGGFFVLQPEVIDYIEGDSTFWEREPLERLAAEGNLHFWRHDGFWQTMDTLREKNLLEGLWAKGDAPWKIW